MKKSWMWSAVTAAAIILLAGCEAKEVKTVRSGVLGIDKSRTVEQALAAKLDDMKWTKINENNHIIVKVTGKWKDKNTVYYMVNGIKYFIVKPGSNVEVCFAMNPDGTFSFNSGKFSRAEGDLGLEVIGRREVKHDDLDKLRGGFLGVLYK